MDKSEEPLVSVIIVNYNGLKHLKDCFDSLYCLDYKNFEILFVDNGSQDDSVKFIKKNYEKIKIIQLDKNYGFCLPNNIAASQANGKYIILLNNDVIVDKKWLTELVKVAETSEDIGVVGSKIYYFDQRTIVNYAGGSLDRFGIIRHVGSGSTDNTEINTQRETFYALGAAELIRKEIIDKVGLFDPTYFAYYEDIDISWLAWILGYKVIYAPKSFIYHKTCQVLNRQYDLIFYLNERNRLRTLVKNFEKKTVLLKILYGYFKNRILILISAIRNSEYYAKIFLRNYFKVIAWNILHLKSLIRNRKLINAHRKKDDKFILQLMDKFVKHEAFMRSYNKKQKKKVSING